VGEELSKFQDVESSEGFETRQTRQVILQPQKKKKKKKREHSFKNYFFDFKLSIRNHWMFLRDRLMIVDLNSFLSSTVILCYCFFKSKQLSRVFPSFGGSGEERVHI
jgi:hypothetical protein